MSKKTRNSKSNTNSNSNKNKQHQTVLCAICILLVVILIITVSCKKEPFQNNNSNNPNNFNGLKFDNKKVNDKYNLLFKQIGSPTYVEISANNVLNSVTWMSPINNYEAGLFNGDSITSKDGLDYIKLNGFVGRKHHPIAADMFVVSGKYIDVPQELLGPLKNASETINIEQLAVPPLLNNEFGKTQQHSKKGKSLVTGSCASVTISTITIKFVEDMIAKFNNGELDNQTDLYRNNLFKTEYDKYILQYLCENQEPNIKWFNPKDFGEPKSMDSLDQCKDIEGFLNYSNLSEQNDVEISKLSFDTNCFNNSLLDVRNSSMKMQESGNYSASANIDSSHKKKTVNNNNNNKKAS
jgi:hypothetical protein